MKILSKAIFVALAVALVGCLGVNKGNPLPGTYQVVAAIVSDVAPVISKTTGWDPAKLDTLHEGAFEVVKVTLDDLKGAMNEAREQIRLAMQGLAKAEDVRKSVSKFRALLDVASDEVLDEFEKFMKSDDFAPEPELEPSPEPRGEVY
jgi:hypothetical protein